MSVVRLETVYLPESKKEAVRIGSRTYFPKDKCKYGHRCEHVVRNGIECIKCFRKYHRIDGRKRYKANPDKYRARFNARSLEDRINDPVKVLLKSSKHGAKIRGIEFSLTRESIIVSENCHCCGFKYDIPNSSGKRSWRTISIDRFDSSKGYTTDNVFTICWRCNHLKSDGTIHELKSIVAWMEKIIEQKKQ